MYHALAAAQTAINAASYTGPTWSTEMATNRNRTSTSDAVCTAAPTSRSIEPETGNPKSSQLDLSNTSRRALAIKRS
jgi:hypothetical protein